MLIAGIVLIVLQVVGLAGSFIGGHNPFNAPILEVIGYFLAGILGVILIVFHCLRKKKKSAAKDNAKSELAVTSDRAELKKVLQDIENDPDRYFMEKSLADKYTRMFNQPFDSVVVRSDFTINGKKCTMYGFSPLYLHSCSVGGFCYFIEVQDYKLRYFASEWSYNNTFYLCEWEFEGERKTAHLNYGEVVSSVGDMMNHSENIKKKLHEILT